MIYARDGQRGKFEIVTAGDHQCTEVYMLDAQELLAFYMMLAPFALRAWQDTKRKPEKVHKAKKPVPKKRKKTNKCENEEIHPHSGLCINCGQSRHFH